MSTSTDVGLKTFENRLRRNAKRRGFQLVKSARRDPYALDYGLYVLVSDGSGGAGRVRGGNDEVEAMFANGEGRTMVEIAETLNLMAAREAGIGGYFSAAAINDTIRGAKIEVLEELREASRYDHHTFQDAVDWADHRIREIKREGAS
jgi:hypothetical protein